MLHLKKTTALVAGSLLTLSGAALAESTSHSAVNDRDRSKNYNMSETMNDNNNREWHGGQYGAIDELPDNGNVTLSGVVEDVDRDDNSFQLMDTTGETIDVHTASNVNVREGEHVRVNGMIEDEALGMGEQIVSASVKRIDVR